MRPAPGSNPEPDFGALGADQQQEDSTDDVDSVAEAVASPVETIE